MKRQRTEQETRPPKNSNTLFSLSAGICVVAIIVSIGYGGSFNNETALPISGKRRIHQIKRLAKEPDFVDVEKPASYLETLETLEQVSSMEGVDISSILPSAELQLALSLIQDDSVYYGPGTASVVRLRRACAHAKTAAVEFHNKIDEISGKLEQFAEVQKDAESASVADGLEDELEAVVQQSIKLESEMGEKQASLDSSRYLLSQCEKQLKTVELQEDALESPPLHDAPRRYLNENLCLRANPHDSPLTL